ncbi:hypothetical protein E2C01_082912 [Portunus trituberculatus]|uniref:Uncharacterized protein n=1 Tax=Portunus trituberculatus TaxID=210409 RepID=A0A5B7J0J2_PORTR|nr:hypothetical protein [Portunus trituberculatus]
MRSVFPPQPVKMARPGVLLLLVLTTLTLAAVCDAFVLCPQFPRCCETRSCHMLCPSCSEAEHFENGVRKGPNQYRPRCGINAIIGDPYALISLHSLRTPCLCPFARPVQGHRRGRRDGTEGNTPAQGLTKWVEGRAKPRSGEKSSSCLQLVT